MIKITAAFLVFISAVFSPCYAHEISNEAPLYIEKKIAVISSGLPRVGKSTLLKELSRRISNSVYLDKDTVPPALLLGQELSYSS